MHDILPAEIWRWQRLEAAFIEAATLHGYSEIRTPILEPTDLFVRSIGESTDVVQKEMYTFQRHDDSLTLRPEGTASAARAYVQHAVQALEPISRWYYLGPMFRAERPARGRQRQFHQAGCEIFGDPGPTCDAEMISMLVSMFVDLGIGELEVSISSLGGPETRPKYRSVLLDFLRPKAADLSEHSRARIEVNPFRVLDSKDEGDRAAVEGAPSILDYLSDEDRAHWDALKTQLEALEVPFRVSPGLVRGLDYYNRTLFEISSSAGELGAQNALAGGGRYDTMVEDLGGPKIPAIGFAMGLERILLAMGESERVVEPSCFVVPMGEKATIDGLVLARELRQLGVRVDVDGRQNSLKSKLRRANSSGARVCAIIGESEIETGTVQLKDLLQHSQEQVPRDRATRIIADRLLGSTPRAGGND